MATEPEYNELTCITAGELRAFGCNVPKCVPDCGWIERKNILLGDPKVSSELQDQNGIVKVSYSVRFMGQFRWVEGTITIPNS